LKQIICGGLQIARHPPPGAQQSTFGGGHRFTTIGTSGQRRIAYELT
jgi:hypothetical protein